MAKRDPRTLKHQAQAALDKGKHKKALELYIELERMEPTDGQWARRAAEMYRRLNKRKESIDALERAATIYMNVGFLVKAIAVCKMILQLDPTHSAVRERLAALNAERGMSTSQLAALSPVPAPATYTRSGPMSVPPESAPVRTPESIPLPPESAPVRAPRSIPLPPEPLLEVTLADSEPDITLEIEPEITLEDDPITGPIAGPIAGPIPKSEPIPGPAPRQAPTPTPKPNLGPSMRSIPIADAELDNDEESLDLAELAALAVQAVVDKPSGAVPTVPPRSPGPPPIPSGPPPIPRRPLPPPIPRRVGQPAGKHGDSPPKQVRTRTIPPDAPLDVIDLSSLIPGAMDIGDEVISEGVIEIPIDLDDDIERPTPALSVTNERALRDTPLLSSLGPDAMRSLIAEVELVDLAPGAVLFREGDPGRKLYVIADGSVSVISEGPPRTHLSTLNEGDFFGEIAIVTNQARTATIEADPERGAHLLAMDRNVIGDLIEAEPNVLQALLRFLRDRLVDRLIHTSPLFAPFTGPDSRALASKFRFLEVPAGARVIEQGMRATGLFVLLAGKLEALRVDDDRDGSASRCVGNIGPGGLCGEMSLLANQPALFSVRAVSKSFVLQMPAQVFREVIMTHPQVLVFVSDLADERHTRYQAILAGDADYEAGRISFI